MELSLYDYLGKVNDTRKKSGLRHPLQSFLTMSVMGIMSGYCGLQELAKFFYHNREKLTEMFDLKHGVASYTQIRTIFKDLDYDSLQTVFEMWSLEYTDLTESDWISVDGKSLRSTVSDYNTNKQNFVAMVNIFVERLGLVLTHQRYENKKASEIHVAQNKLSQLLNQLKVKGIIVSLDAIHCQKKRSA